MSRFSGSCPFKIDRDRIEIAATFALIVGIVARLVGLSAHAAAGVERKSQFAAPPPAIFGPSAAQPEPLRLADAALEPIEWNDLEGWSADDHAAAFATFLASCRPLLRSSLSEREKRPMYPALVEACRRALAAGRLTEDQARQFLERNFRPLRITKLGDNAGFLTGYYEPIVDGSRFPTGIFKVPIYRRPPDLVPPPHSAGPGFPNRDNHCGGQTVAHWSLTMIGARSSMALSTANILRSVGSRTSRMLLLFRSRDQRACASKTESYCASTTMDIMATHLCHSAAFSSSVTSFRARRYRPSESVTGYAPTDKALRNSCVKIDPLCSSVLSDYQMIGDRSPSRRYRVSARRLAPKVYR